MSKTSEIYDLIYKAINSYRTPPPTIPPLLLISGAKLRPGLSASLTAAKIISRQSEGGAPAGVLPSGAKNVSEAMEVIRIEEIFNALLNDARIDIAVNAGIPVQANGACAVGPVSVAGMTIGIGSGNGIVR
jgi:hypothetical protein